jgi:spermidine/putrescine transport system permease protein
MEHLKLGWRSSLRAAALLFGSLVFLVGLFLLPLAELFAESFAERGRYGVVHWIFTLGNYFRAFHPLYLEIYWRSLWIALVTTLICAILGYVLAYTIALRISGPWKSPLLMLVVIPFWTSYLIRTYAWMLIFRAQGVLNDALLWLGVIHQPLQLLYTTLAVFVGLVYAQLPFMILPLYAVLQKLDPALLEAAEDLGANRWRTFFRVTLPLSLSGLAAGSALVFISALGAFITPDLLGGARSMMVGNLIENQFAVARNQPFGSAVSFLLTFFVLALLLVSLRAAERGAKEMF